MWTPAVGKILAVDIESGNTEDRYAVAVDKDGTVVGDIPREYSKLCGNFLLFRFNFTAWESPWIDIIFSKLDRSTMYEFGKPCRARLSDMRLIYRSQEQEYPKRLINSMRFYRRCAY